MNHHFDYIDEPLLLFRTGHASLTQRAAERRKLLLKTIIPHLLDECGGRERVSRQAIHYAYGSISKNLGDDLLPNSRLAAGYWYLRALRHCPTMLEMWKGLAKLFLPTNFKRSQKASQLKQEISA
jgi:hypothetical protein